MLACLAQYKVLTSLFWALDKLSNPFLFTLRNHSNDLSTRTSITAIYYTTQARRHPPHLPFPSAQPRQMPVLHLSTAERLELTRSDPPLVCPSSQFSQYPAYHPTPDTNATILVPKILTSRLFSYL